MGIRVLLSRNNDNDPDFALYPAKENHGHIPTVPTA